MGYLDNNGLAYFWNKVKNYVDTAVSAAGGGHAKATVSLTAASWSLNSDGYYYQTKSVTGVTASNTVIVDTDNPHIKCTAQAAGSLTFRSTVAEAATVKVVILS